VTSTSVVKMSSRGDLNEVDLAELLLRGILVSLTALVKSGVSEIAVMGTIASLADLLKKNRDISLGCGEDLSPISRLIKGIVRIVEHFTGTGMDSLCAEIADFVDALRVSGLQGTIAPVIVWQNAYGCRHFPAQLKLPNATEAENNNGDIFTMRLGWDRLPYLNHSMEARRLLPMLNLEGGFGYGHRFQIMTNRVAEKGILSDIAPSGLLYCGVQVNRADLPKAFRASKPFENRYGSCVLTFNYEKMMDGNRTSWFELGTKFYTREWSQLILVDGQCNTEVHVIDLKDCSVYSVLPIHNINGYVWKLSYNSRDESWTKPSFVFAEPIYPNNCIAKCIQNKRCLECKLILEGNGSIKARKIVQLPNLELRAETFRRSFPIHSQFYQAVQGYNVKPDLAIFMFSLSVPVSQRGMLYQMQAERGVFDAEQFGIITGCWQCCPTEYYDNWST
jgi:hypothetical protein